MIELAAAMWLIQSPNLSRFTVPCFPAPIAAQAMEERGYWLDEMGLHHGGKLIVQVWRNDEGTAMIGTVRPDGQYCAVFTIDGGFAPVPKGDPA